VEEKRTAIIVRSVQILSNPPRGGETAEDELNEKAR